MKKFKRFKGAIIIEFVFSFVIFWIFFILIIEFGRAFVAWNAASEATRFAARIASICTLDNNVQRYGLISKISPLMKISGQAGYYPDGVDGKIVSLGATDEWLKIERFPNEPQCTERNCEHLTVSLNQVYLELNLIVVNLHLKLPPNQVTVMRESMRTLFPTGIDNNNTQYCPA